MTTLKVLYNILKKIEKQRNDFYKEYQNTKKDISERISLIGKAIGLAISEEIIIDEINKKYKNKEVKHEQK